jgi:hypothetical protein
MGLLDREVRNSGFVGPLAYYHVHGTRDGAPLLDELWAVLDHAHAHSLGGPNDTGSLESAPSETRSGGNMENHNIGTDCRICLLLWCYAIQSGLPPRKKLANGA